MKNEPLKILQQSLRDLTETNKWLQRSFAKCEKIGIKKNYSPDEFDAFENLTSRFARACDFLTNKVYRSIDRVELENPGTLIDILNRAHKRGLVSSMHEIREIKELRNTIAHEYANNQLQEIFEAVFNHIQTFTIYITKAQTYCQKYNS